MCTIMGIYRWLHALKVTGKYELIIHILAVIYVFVALQYAGPDDNNNNKRSIARLKIIIIMICISNFLQ